MIFLKKELAAHVKRHKRLHKGCLKEALIYFYRVGDKVHMYSHRKCKDGIFDTVQMDTVCQLEADEVETREADAAFAVPLPGLMAVIKHAGNVVKLTNSDCLIYEDSRFNVSAGQANIAENFMGEYALQFTFPRKPLVELTECFNAALPDGLDVGATLLIKEGRLTARRIHPHVIYEMTAKDLPTQTPTEGDSFYASMHYKDAPLLHAFLKDAKADTVRLSQNGQNGFLYVGAGEEWMIIATCEKARKISDDVHRMIPSFPNGLEVNTRYVSAMIESHVKTCKKRYPSIILTPGDIKGYGYDEFCTREEIEEFVGSADLPMAQVNARYFLDAIRYCGKAQESVRIDFLHPLAKSFARVSGKEGFAIIAGIYA